MRIDSLAGYLDQIERALSGPMAPVLIGGALLFAILQLAVPRMRWISLTLVLYLCTLQRLPNKWYDLTLSFPLETLSNYSRVLTLLILVLLAVPAVFMQSGWRRHPMTGAVYAFFAFEAAYAIRLIASPLSVRGVLGLVAFTLTLLAIGYGLSRWLQSFKDVNNVLRCIVAAAALIVLGTLYHLAVNPGAVNPRGRLYATTSNPQAVATIFALTLPCVCYLIVRDGAKKSERMVLTCLGAIMAVMLVWTGSRTGMLMTVLGLGLLFRTRISRMAIVVGLLAVMTLGLMQVFTDTSDSAERLLSTEDTRTAKWLALMEKFAQNPMVGRPDGDYVGTENSYLLIAAQTGTIGLFFLTVAIVASGYLVYRLQKARHLLGPHAMLVDLLVSGIVAVGVCAVFEGILLAMITFHLFFIYIYFGIAAFVLEVTTRRSPKRRRRPRAVRRLVPPTFAPQQG